MKIVFGNKDKTNLSYHTGLARALNYCGHECILWDMSKQSSLEMFRQLSPDIVFANTKDIDNGIIVGHQKFPDIKFCLTVSDDNSFVFNEVEFVRQIKSNRLILTFPGLPDIINKVAKYWLNFGFFVNSSLTAGDVFGYKPGRSLPEFTCDVSLIGSPNKTSEYYMSALCRPDTPFKTKIFGDGNWGVMQECGEIPESYYQDICQSSTVCTVFNEKCQEGYLINDILWYMAINKYFFITNEPVISGLVTFSNQNEFLSQIEKFTSNPNLRDKHINYIQECVLNKHTYFHRAIDIFYYLNMIEEGDKCVDKFAEFKEGL